MAACVPRLELPVQRGLAPPGVAGVHEIVVDQRTGMQQFQGRRGSDDLRAVRPARTAPAPVAERGPQPLAPGQQARDRLGSGQQFSPGGEQHVVLLAEERLQCAVHPVTDLAQHRGARCHARETR